MSLLTKYLNKEQIRLESKFLLSEQSFPSGKQSNPFPFLGSLPQSLGRISSFPVATGFSVPPVLPVMPLELDPELELESRNPEEELHV